MVSLVMHHWMLEQQAVRVMYVSHAISLSLGWMMFQQGLAAGVA